MGRILHFAFVLTVIAVISSGVLAFVNDITKNKIAVMDKKVENEARLEALSGAVRFDENKEIKKGGYSFVPGYDKNDKIVGYVTAIDTPGYGSSIKFVMGINSEGKITGLRITDAARETPGLGAKITDKKWQDLWIGRDINYEFNKEIDGFAGATISPKGVYFGIKRGLKGYNQTAASEVVTKDNSNLKSNDKKTKDPLVVSKAKEVVAGTASCGIEAIEINGIKYMSCYNEKGEKIGYMAYADADGYSGPIKCRIGVDINGKVVSVLIDSIGENIPDYNNGIQDKKWLGHWSGKDKNYIYSQELDGTAGATISPKAIFDAIKNTLDGVDKINGGGV